MHYKENNFKFYFQRLFKMIVIIKMTILLSFILFV